MKGVLKARFLQAHSGTFVSQTRAESSLGALPFLLDKVIHFEGLGRGGQLGISRDQREEDAECLASDVCCSSGLEQRGLLS